MNNLRKYGAVLFLLVAVLFSGCFSQKDTLPLNAEKQISRGFSSAYATMYFRGTANGWAATPMTLTNNNEWTIKNVKFGLTSSERFKFDVYANWATNFGDTNKDGIAGFTEADIFVVPGKTYDIIFNDSTKKYIIQESAVTNCLITTLFLTGAGEPILDLTGVKASLYKDAALVSETTISTTASAMFSILAAGTYKISANSVLKSGTDEYQVAGERTFTVAATDKSMTVYLELIKTKIVKGNATVSMNVSGATIADFLTLYTADSNVIKVYKDGVLTSVDKTVTPLGVMSINNIVAGNYKVTADYNVSGKKYAGETTFAITSTSTIAAAALNITYTENKVYLKTYPQMYLRGTPNGWGTTAMILTADYTWSLTGIKTGGTATERIKFDVYGNWTTNFGLNGVAFGGDIPLEANSTYDISFNDNTKKYVITKQTSSLVIASTSGKIKKGDTTFALPVTGTYANNGLTSTVNLTWTPAIDVNKLGDTIYSATYNGLTVKYTLNVWEPLPPSLTIGTTSWTVKKGDTTFKLPATGTYTKDAVDTQVALTWTPALDVNKTGETVYTGTANGLSVTYKLTVSDSFTSVYPTMNVRGTVNSWGNTPMVLISDYTWSVKGIKSGATALERFKFDVKGDWTLNFGLNGVSFGADIPLEPNSTYDVTFNDQTKKYTVTKITIPTLTIDSIKGSIRKGDATFKLPVSGTYTANGTTQSVALTWTPALDINKAGDTIYTGTANGLSVTYTLNVNDSFISTYPVIYFRGTPNGWATTKMTLIADYTWQIEADFAGVTTGTNPDRFKFDTKGDWLVNFGDNEADGIAETGMTTKDIFVKSGAGKYTITFNDLTKVYSVVKKPTSIAVTGVKIPIGNLTINSGEAKVAMAYIEPVDATNRKINYESMNTTVATVKDGVVMALVPGVTTIVATTEEGGFKDSIEVTVLPSLVPVTGVRLSMTGAALEKTEKVTLEEYVLPAESINHNVTWSSSDTNVVTVKNGVVTAVNAGTATVTVTTQEGGFKADAVFTVTTPTPIFIPVEGGAYPNNSNVRVGWNFSITRHEITQNEFTDIMGRNPSQIVAGRNPVDNVNYLDVVQYCNALSIKEGLPKAYDEATCNLLDGAGNVTEDVTKVKGYRLPTEDEWDFAGKGGKYSKGFSYSGSNDVNAVGWYFANAGRKHHQVESKGANELGLYDMSGNVWEHCLRVRNSSNASGWGYVIRGGSWAFLDCMTEIVGIGSFDATNSAIGFRVVKTAN